MRLRSERVCAELDISDVVRVSRDSHAGGGREGTRTRQPLSGRWHVPGRIIGRIDRGESGELMTVAEDDQLETVTDAQLAENRAQMVPNGDRAHKETKPRLLIGQSPRDKCADLAFAQSQRGNGRHLGSTDRIDTSGPTPFLIAGALAGRGRCGRHPVRRGGRGFNKSSSWHSSGAVLFWLQRHESSLTSRIFRSTRKCVRHQEPRLFKTAQKSSRKSESLDSGRRKPVRFVPETMRLIHTETLMAETINSRLSNLKHRGKACVPYNTRPAAEV
jgi:hypothetical protein